MIDRLVPILPREYFFRMGYAEQWRLRARLVHNNCTPRPSLSAIDMACEAFVDYGRVRQQRSVSCTHTWYLSRPGSFCYSCTVSKYANKTR